jgi:CDP-diacylglycerol--glycerol-3-phosphate 3-phosphatidyltransferase
MNQNPKSSSATASVARPRFWNVPNSLTIGRLALSALVFGLIATGNFGWSLVVFILAALSDALDGYFARLLNQGTALGRQLDPLVDKVIVCGTYIYLIAIPGTGIWPGMVAIIVIRELLIQGLRSHLEGKGQNFGAKMAGKLKTLFQCLSICAVLLALSYDVPPAPLVLVRDLLTWTAVLLTLWSGLSYGWSALPILRREFES